MQITTYFLSYSYAEIVFFERTIDLEAQLIAIRNKLFRLGYNSIKVIRYKDNPGYIRIIVED